MSTLAPIDRATLLSLKHGRRFLGWFPAEMRQAIGALSERGLVEQIASVPEGVFCITSAGRAALKAEESSDPELDAMIDDLQTACAALLSAAQRAGVPGGCTN